MRSFKGVNFGTLLSSPKEAEELLPDLKVGVLSGFGYIWLSKLSCFVFCPISSNSISSSFPYLFPFVSFTSSSPPRSSCPNFQPVLPTADLMQRGDKLVMPS